MRECALERSYPSKTYLDIQEVFSEDGRSVINWDTRTIELATKHLSGDWHAEHITCEFTMSIRVINISSAFENLNTQRKVRITRQLYQWTTRYLPGRLRVCQRFQGLVPCAFGRLQASR